MARQGSLQTTQPTTERDETPPARQTNPATASQKRRLPFWPSEAPHKYDNNTLKFWFFANIL